MSVVAIVLIVLGVLLLLFLAGGILAARRQGRLGAGALAQSLGEADRALEQARAADKGWDRAVLEATARRALEGQRPGVRYERLELVLVDDRPGTTEDRAHFRASGPDGEARVVLTRREEGWAAERVE